MAAGSEQGDIDAVFHALAEPTRRAIVERLSSGSASVSDLAGMLDLTLAAIVQHLKVLEACRLVRTEKVGRVRTCRGEPRGLRLVEQWVAQRRARVERQLDRLAVLLDEQDEDEQSD